VALLGLSSVLILASRIEALGSALPLAVITVAALAMAAGTLLLGTSESGRPV
jgi:hypothetical protein